MMITRDEILKMEAGNEIDALVEVYVLGDDGTNATNKHYSTDISAAWEVVEKMKASVKNLNLREYAYNRTYATFGDSDMTAKWAEANGENSASLAICRAALLAVCDG